LFTIRQQVLASQRNLSIKDWGEQTRKARRKSEGNIVLDAVDLRDRVIQRVSDRYNGMDKKRFLTIEAGSAQQAWVKAGRASAAIGNTDCGSCRHRHCTACEECSVTERYSDYWICHRCGELNPRVPNSH
jgi:hypothetical protein